ncbi:hypothetical protein BJ165DRAFT_97842 [Panaeolus papilionaceus]|nr:hypothetical protein BJ165DRAFT_97842 [Panaeolus papilionaceus]
MTMSSDSPAQVLVKLEQVSIHRKTSHSIYKFFKDLEESKHEESFGWKKKYQELEQEYNKMKLDIENAVSARDGVLRKLKHARKVIRDLLIERSDMQSPRAEPMVSQAEIDAALHDGVVRKMSPPSTPTSNKSTVRRPSPAPTLPSTPPIPSPHRSIPFDPDRMVANSSSKRGMPSNEPSGRSNSSIKQPPQAPSSSFQLSRPSPAWSTTSLSSEEELYIHYSIPSSHQIVKGPYSKEQLHQDLDLNISDVRK